MIPINEEETPLGELAGSYEYTTQQQAVEDDDNLEDPQPSTSKKRKRDHNLKTQTASSKYTARTSFGTPKWTKRHTNQFNYDFTEKSTPLEDCQANLYNKIKDLTPYELFAEFFDIELTLFILHETNIYAQQRNSNFRLDKEHLLRFIGILLLSGYHTLPCNNELDTTDKMAKIRKLFDLINKKFTKYGVWSEELSIDEQMVPYFGRHSCKMYIKGKPILFGYKLWCLCASNGYLFFVIPYSGASDFYDSLVGLGADVVLRLLDNVDNPECHKIFFDNFFSSYYLTCLLNERRFKATGTICKNRTSNAPLKTGRELQRGSYDFAFDKKNKLLFCRWQDNSEVTVCTNYDQIQPTTTVRRWERKSAKFVNHQQPLVLKNYNKGMGGVDLHDNAVQNYRVNIKAKKWYWPLWLSVLNSSVVNAWKLHCFLARYEKKKPMSQKQFRVSITERLLLTADNDSSSQATDSSDDIYRPRNLPQIAGKHLIVQQTEKKVRRCKLKGCGKPTYYMCKKCNVHLHTKCFEKFHNKT